MVIGNPDAVATANNGGAGGVAANAAHPSGIPQDQIDNIMSGIANTGDVKMNNHRKKLRQRFDIIKKLGQGTYGKVQLGINKETGQEVAIKTIKKCKIEAEADLVRIRREVQIMSSVQHPNIIHIYEVFENREKMVLVMEFAAGGELYDYLSERKVLTEEEARRIFRQVATAVYYCHKHKICHRDLKLENILLDETGNAKIADFGLSNVFDDQRLLATFCGSPLYASPEIVEGTPYQGPEVDCWSLGVLLYTLVYGSMPFDGSNFKRLVKQISLGDYYEPKKPSRATTLIRDMLTVSPRKRATIEQICSHWWVNENDNLSCLDLAENLANQTPVRLDVLLSLTPAAITADQLVVPSADSGATGKGGERVARSHSVGSIRDIGANTEAERRILDMVAAGGEAALMPSPTRTITPAQSPIQSKRKLETTMSMENAASGVLKKKDKQGSQAALSALVIGETTSPLTEETPMDTEDAIVEEPKTPAVKNVFSQKDIQVAADMMNNEQMMPSSTSDKKLLDMASSAGKSNSSSSSSAAAASTALLRQRTTGNLPAVEESPEEKDTGKVGKKFTTKHKTTDLANVIGQVEAIANVSETAVPSSTTPTAPIGGKTGGPPAAAVPFVRKCSLQSDELPQNKVTGSSNTTTGGGERRKSRILETAEKFQPPPPPTPASQTSMTMANSSNSNGATSTSTDKPKKFAIPGVSVGSFKKEFERKASTPAIQTGPTAGELRALEQVAAAAAAAEELENAASAAATATATATPPSTGPGTPAGGRIMAAGGSASALESSDSKNSVASLSLDDARRSMENSIALLRQAQTESSKDLDQLCAKTESFSVNDPGTPTTPGSGDNINPLDAAIGGGVERERKLKNARAIIGNAIQPVICWPQPPQPQAQSFVLTQAPQPSQHYGMPYRGNNYSGIIGNGNGHGRGSGNTSDSFSNNHYSYISSQTKIQNQNQNQNQNTIPFNNNNRSFFYNHNNNHNHKDFYSNSNASDATKKLSPSSKLSSLSFTSPLPTTNFHPETGLACVPTISSGGGGAAVKAAARQTILDRLASAASILGGVTTTTLQQQQQQQQPPPPPLPRTQFSSSGQPIYNNNSNNNNNNNNSNSNSNSNANGNGNGSQVRLRQMQLQQKQLPSLPYIPISPASQQQLQQQQLQQQQQQQQQHNNFQQQQQQQHYSQQQQQHQRPLPSYSAPPFAAAAAATPTSGQASQPITANTNSVPKPFYNAPSSLATMLLKSSPGGDPNSGNGTVKTSTASITLKSATLPRRKPAKTEIQLDIKPRIVEQPSMRFTTEMQHPIADLRSAPAREGPSPFSPVKTSIGGRATSLEPKEHVITIQRQQPAYTRTTSNTTNRSGSLSRQSTVDSESDTATTATNMSQATMTGSSQPIKKSPREFIIPIAMEGGGFITPREGSIEPSESTHTNTSSRTTFNRLRPTRRIGSLLSDSGIDEASPFPKMRTSSANRETDDDPRFTLHRLRSTRPMKKVSQDNDSQSSGEEDDDDGFEILTAENLFSTLLQRVRALTNRFNVNNDLSSGFPNSSRLLGNMRTGQSPFWNQEPFSSRLNNTGAPWRHSMARDMGNDSMDSMFSRTGATLPRAIITSRRNSYGHGHCGGVCSIGEYSCNDCTNDDNDSFGSGSKLSRVNRTQSAPNDQESPANADSTDGAKREDIAADEEPLDLADLDLSRLRLSKKDLETLSSITPGLPKCFQEQLLAKLPPTQARKLSRTLSMQNSPHVTTVKVYKRSQSGGRGTLPDSVQPLPLPLSLSSELKEETTTSMDDESAGKDDDGAADESTSSRQQQQTVAHKTQVYRRTSSYNRYDTDTISSAGGGGGGGVTGDAFSTPPSSSSKSRSSSLCRDYCTKSMYSTSPATYASSGDAATNDKYRYYSPYLTKSMKGDSTNSTESGSISPQKRYNSTSSSKDSAGRPPSGCLSPPVPLTMSTTSMLDSAGATLRRHATIGGTSTQHRRLSRLIRPELYDDLSPDDASYRLRDRDLLRDIREKSCESGLDAMLNSSGEGEQIEQIPGRKSSSSHVRNRSLDAYTAEQQHEQEQKQERMAAENQTDNVKHHRRSLSRPRNFSDEMDKHELADRILKELQLLSAIRSQHESRLSVPRETSLERTLDEKSGDIGGENIIMEDHRQEDVVKHEKTGTIRKVKKVKAKEKDKSIESATIATEGDYKLASTVVKKVKKIVKKSDNLMKSSATPVDDSGRVEDTIFAERPPDDTTLKRESKLKRPTSYPTKEFATKSVEVSSSSSGSTRLPIASGKTAPTAIPEDLADVEAISINPTTASGSGMRESRLVRPKSYPASKLTPPKDASSSSNGNSNGTSSSKKVTRSGAAIANIIEDGVDDKSIVGETTSAVTATLKKVKKKSKLVQPTPLSPVNPDGPSSLSYTGNVDGGSKESSPSVGQQSNKERSPEKKSAKGLFYAIGQKFEKLRDSAMNKEKRSTSASTATAGTLSGSASNAGSKKSSPEHSSPEKIKEKSTLLKKKSVKTDKNGEKINGGLSKDSTSTATTSSKVKNIGDGEKPAKSDKRSRIDAMIRSLRERSVPRSLNTTESNYIKRAVSVEEMPGTFNRTAVNKVLGLFKRFDKDTEPAANGDRRVRNTRSTSNIDRQMRDGSPPTTPISPIYQNTDVHRRLQKKMSAVTAAAAAVAASVPNIEGKKATACSTCEAAAAAVAAAVVCPDCPDCPDYELKRERSSTKASTSSSLVMKRRDETGVKSRDSSGSFKDPSTIAGNKDKRKGLMLDLDAAANASSVYNRISAKAAYLNGNGIYSNLPPYPGAVHSSSNNSSSLTSTTENTASTYNTNNNNNNNNNHLSSNINNNNSNNNNHSNNNNNNTTTNNSSVGNSSSLNNNNNNNNNNTSSSLQTSGYRTSSAHEINRNHVLTTPSSENVAYSSDSRSYHDDCASTSTFMSPTEEVDLCFDNWSICSEDNYMLHATPSPTVSRLSRGSQRSSPTRGDGSDPNESMIDRIKRRSFYCRFNDKKPRRTSSIVGPTAVRDYYREQKAAANAAANKLRSVLPKPISPDERRASSPDITQQFLRPLKLSPAGTELKPPVYRSLHDSASSAARKPRKSLNDIRPPISSSSSSYLSKRFDTIHASNEHMDYLGMSSPPPTTSSTSRYKPTYESNGGGYYSTYNPKRRSSYTLNGISGSLGMGTSSLGGSSGGTSSNLDGYATVGRRTIRPYDQRTRSLLDPSVIASTSSTSSSSYLRRDSRTPVHDYTPSISRSSPRYRTSSMSRSPTNI